MFYPFLKFMRPFYQRKDMCEMKLELKSSSCKKRELLVLYVCFTNYTNTNFSGFTPQTGQFSVGLPNSM